MKCDHCQKEFEVPKPSRKVRRYCGLKCARKAISTKLFARFHKTTKAKWEH